MKSLDLLVVDMPVEGSFPTEPTTHFPVVAELARNVYCWART